MADQGNSTLLTAARARKLTNEISEARQHQAKDRLEKEQLEMAIRAIKVAVKQGQTSTRLITVLSIGTRGMLDALGYHWSIQHPDVGQATGGETRISW